MAEDPSSLQLMKGTFSSAKLFRGATMILYLSAISLGIVATICQNPSISLLAPFIMAFLHALSFASEDFSRVERSRAETLRRALILDDGLGWAIPFWEDANLKAEASWTSWRYARRADRSPYYAWLKPQGAGRLLQNVCESVFFTRHIARKASQWSWGGSITVGVLSLGALLYAILVVPQRSTLLAVAHGAVLALLIAAAGPPLRDALAFGRLANRCELLDERAERMAGPQLTEELALKMLYTYDSSRLSAPPLPEFIYRCMRNRLNALWEKRIGNCRGSPDL